MKLYTQIFLTLICLHAHFTHAFQATRSESIAIPARSIQQPLLDYDSDSAAFYPSFYQHLHSFTSTSSLSERAQAEQEASFPFMSLPSSEQSCSSTSSSSATTENYVAMHPITTESVGSYSTATTSAQSTSSSTTIPLYEFQNLPELTELRLQSRSGKIITRLEGGSSKKYGLDICIYEPNLKSLFTKIDQKTIQEKLTEALKGSATDDWILKIDKTGNFLILFADRERVDFRLDYRFISQNDFKQRIREQQSHHDIVDIRYEPTTKKIIASCKNKTIKVFETNPLKLAYNFKSRTTSTGVDAPAIATSRDLIIVGSAHQLEIYKETNDGKNIQPQASYKLLYEDSTQGYLRKPNITSLEASAKPSRNIIGTLAVDKDRFFFALQILHLIHNNLHPSKPAEIIRLPKALQPDPYTIINRSDGSFLVPCNDNAEQLRFRSEKHSRNWSKENPYYQNVIAEQTIPSQIIFDIFTIICKGAKDETDEYLIFRKTPYVSNNYEEIDTDIAAHLSFLPKEIKVIVCEYLKKRFRSEIYECFYAGKRVPLIPLEKNRYACVFKGNIVVFDATNLINIKTDPAIAKSLRAPIPF